MIPYNTGPAHIYVGVGAAPPLNPLNPGGGRVYLGTCEQAPSIRWEPGWEPVMNDITGSRKPFDYIYEGTDAMISGDLTVFNWAIWERIKSLPNFALPNGRNEPGDIGTLMITEGMAYPLWIQYPHAAKAVFRDHGMVGGHRFVAAFMMGPYEESPGTKANRYRCQFYAMRAYDRATGRVICSDNNMDGIPTFPPASPMGA